MKSFPFYSIVVDYVRMLEIKEMEARVSQEKTKKHKTEGAYGGQSSGTFNKGSKPQIWKENTQGSFGSTR